MKKFNSLLLALVMVLSLSVTAFAEEPYETNVTFTGNGVEEFEVTVPGTLAPGASGDVTATGTWASNKTLEVSCDESVTLTNSILSSDTKTLTVTFDGISLAGSNTAEVSATKQVSVADITDALFGTWSGTFNYTVGFAA